MTAVLGANSWGKSSVRLVRIDRDPHDPTVMSLLDLMVDTTLIGDAEDVYARGDNAKILSTDAQKNTVYAFAGQRPHESAGELAARLAEHFVTSQEPVHAAAIEITARPWRRVVGRTGPAPHSFEGPAGEDRVHGASYSMDRSGSGTLRMSGGVRGLRLLNATGSEFRNFPRDRYTTGRDVTDRVLATELDATWHHDGPGDDSLGDEVRAILVQEYAGVYSKSIQFTMQAVADAVFAAQPRIDILDLRVPNLHHYPVDLAPFGMENQQQVFMVAAQPHSLIEAHFSRG